MARFAERLASQRSETQAGAHRSARLTVVKDQAGEPRVLSRGGLALIGVGRLKWKGRKARRVAVKFFRYPVSDEDATRMTRCIQALTDAGVALPPMALTRYQRKWVLVSPLFGSWLRGSKLSQPTDLMARLLPPQQEFAIEQLTRVAIAGYKPSSDLFLLLGERDGGLIPIDLDLIVEEPSSCFLAKELMKRVIQVGESPSRREQLARIVEETCQNRRASALWAMFQSLRQPGTPFRRLWDHL